MQPLPQNPGTLGRPRADRWAARTWGGLGAGCVACFLGLQLQPVTAF